jgi:predicted ATP-dependent endonuclease of OLD family
MQIKFVEILNFRKLKSIRIDLTPSTTLFVGANNSGKTSAMAALTSFLVNRNSFSTYDFTLSNWKHIDAIGKNWEDQPPTAPTDDLPADWKAVLPCLDVWLQIESDEIHYVSQLLPSLDWEGGLLGVRLRYEPKKLDELTREFLVALGKARETSRSGTATLDPRILPVAVWPRTLREFLDKRLAQFFTIRAYSLDPAKQTLPQNGIAAPQALPSGSQPVEVDLLDKLIKIDVIYAQREFADVDAPTNQSDGTLRRRRTRLTSQFLAYYSKHLNPLDSPDPSDLDALRAIQEAQRQFDGRLKSCFSPAISEIANLGYPGVTDPKLTIATEIHLDDSLNHKAAIQYDLLPGGDPEGALPLRLPEAHNGLGYQNLISIVFELMSFRDAWMKVGKARKKLADDDHIPMPPLHLVLIEEPEAHLHAQVQQVFINKAYQLLRAHSDLGDNKRLVTQLIVSTHSSHVAHECDFSCLRYFRRRPAMTTDEVPTVSVINLSTVFGGVSETQRFVTRYLKATHCDLFFADAAVLVEGPAERILVPHFVRDHFPKLSQSYLTLLEIGGSHAHRLRPLIESLGLTTLVITDIDATTSSGKTVPPARNKGLVTRNTTLKTWLPKLTALDELLDASTEQKTRKSDDLFSVRVAYQTPVQVGLRPDGQDVECLANTFEDALAYENMEILKGSNLGGEMARLREALTTSDSPELLAQKMQETLKSAKKAELALDLLQLEDGTRAVCPPKYIKEGLSWLELQLTRNYQELNAPAIQFAATLESAQ